MKQTNASRQNEGAASDNPRQSHKAKTVYRRVAIIAACCLAATLMHPGLRQFWFPQELCGLPGVPLTRYPLKSRPDPETSSARVFDWLEIEATGNLVWHPCWDDRLQCARLSLPIDWNDTANPERVQIALVKLPARVPVDHESYGGPLLLNPGGPGNSGIYEVLAAGRYIQTIIDPAEGQDGKFFDVIGFDPRGVNNTTPQLTCFPDARTEAKWMAEAPSGRMLGNDRLLNENWAHKKALGLSCATDRGDGPNVVRYVNTAQTVKDIVAIIEKHGEWREDEAKRLASLDGAASDNLDVLERTRWKKDAEPLNFWGISYGTLLGQTFAAMYPERSHRLILDGVVNTEDCYGAKWLTGLQDTDQIIAQWGDYCFAAGEACPLHRPGVELPALFQALLARDMAGLIENPVPIDTERGPAVIYYDDMMGLLRQALYAPYRYAEAFITVLDELERGNTSALAQWKAQNTETTALSHECEQHGPFSEACRKHQTDMAIYTAIICSDSDDVTNHTKDFFREYAEKLHLQSDAMGDGWGSTMLGCINWPTRPAWTFKGPISGTPAHPILFIGNTYDNVTPLRNAKYSAEKFAGSVVLQPNIEGHASYANPSICTAKALRAYLQTGSLPEPGTICEPEYRPWVGCVNPKGCEGWSLEDQALFDAMNGMAMVLPPMDLPGLES